MMPEHVPDLSDNARAVLEKRYLIRDASGVPTEEPIIMFRRVAADIAAAESGYGTTHDVADWEQRFLDVMVAREFLPNSPTLMNAGRELQQLSACFVLPIPDSMDKIFETLKDAALIHKSGGGTGFSFSSLRPRGDAVESTSGVASGPVSFLAVYDAATEHVKQGGTRRGANMAILRVDHPDILDFVHAKTGDERITNFNISVGVDAEFMRHVESDEAYDLINPRSGEAVGRLRAREVFDEIVRSAWRSGDPGIVFLDRMNEARTNPTPELGEIESTNPCGEQPLLAYESCNLGSLNIARFVDPGGSFEFDRLREVIHVGVRFLDDVIDRTRYPLPQIAEVTRGNRKIGLGVMGWADALIACRVPYDSEEAVALGEEMMAFVASEADAASEALAAERGVFPNWNGSYYAEIGRPMRNATRTTVAPTGTISIIADASSGIEPLFALAFHRKVLDGEVLLETNPHFADVADAAGFATADLFETVAARGSVRGLESLPEDVQRIFATAYDVAPEWHVRMQAAFQRHTDNAVSKTVNMANDASVEDVAGAFRLAFELGCKGVTVYRDRSKRTQVLNLGVDTGFDAEQTRLGPSATGAPAGVLPETSALRSPEEVLPRPVPSEPAGLEARRFRVSTPLGTMNVFVTELDNEPFEVFVVFGKAGSDLTAMSEAIGRLISLLLRSRVPVGLVIDQLRGIGGRSSIGFGSDRVLSVVDALAKLLDRHYGPQGSRVGVDAFETSGLDVCPQCLEYAFEFSEGCGKCHACGHSTC